jgi:manganese-dependent ADP-ribose/CDP-alcohol diphosphatase
MFSFGVFADIQYADLPDGWNFQKTERRYYRHALEGCANAVKSWNEEKLSLAIDLGDIIDGYNAHPPRQSEKSLARILECQSAFKGRIYHMLGNHELYNFDRSVLKEKLGFPNELAYYDIEPHKRVRIVVLDAYDISLLGWPSTHAHHSEAKAILAAKNPNQVQDSAEGLVGVARRFVKFNGAVGKEQLKWLEGVLIDATKKGQIVIVASHVPLTPGSCDNIALLWNYDEVLAVLHKYSCVKALFHGHDHDGGHHVDKQTGLHTHVFEAILTCAPGEDSFGTVDVYDDRLELRGVGRMTSMTMKFRK